MSVITTGGNPQLNRHGELNHLLTIEGLLSGHERAQYLDLSQGAVTFKKAPREKGPKAKQAKLL